MDENDIKILQAIAESGTHSPNKMHKLTGIPESTIYYRLDKLREEGIIKNDLYDIDYEKLGLGVTIIVEVVATYKEGYHDKIGEKLSNIEGTSQVYFTMGKRDFVVIAHVPDRKGVKRLISDFESVEEVERTESKFTIATIKNEPRFINSYSTETLTSMLADSEGF